MLPAHAQKAAPGATGVGIARCRGLCLKDADGDDIDRAVHRLEQALDVQDRARVTLDERQPEPNRRMARPASKAGAEPVRLEARGQWRPDAALVIVGAERVGSHLDEAEAKAAERADGERIGVDSTAKADRASQWRGIGRGLQASVRRHPAEKVHEKKTARDRGDRLEAAQGQGSARRRRKPGRKRFQQRMIGPVRHRAPADARRPGRHRSTPAR